MFRTHAEADAAEEKAREELKAQRGRTPQLPKDITWAALFERVMRDRSDLKPRSLECYRETNTRYLLPEFGATAVRDLTRLRIREFLRSQLATKSRNTVRLMCATLHVVLAEAADDDLISGNPAAGLTKKLRLSPKVKPDRRP